VKRAFAALAATVVGALLAPVPAYADPIRDSMWHLRSLDVAEAHKRTDGRGVTVAVVAGGVDATHPDLAGAVQPAIGPSGPVDPGGRGTAMAGLVAGRGHGSGGADGVAGIAPGASVLPVIAENTDEHIRGIETAAQRGASVICVGLALPATAPLAQAVAAAGRAGSVVVLADGADYQADPALLVAAPLPRESAAPALDARPGLVAAPGEQITSTNTGGGYRIDAGAVAAAGVLCGAAALVRAAHHALPPAEITHRVGQTLGSNRRLDLVAALTRTVPLLNPPSPSPSPSATTAPSSAAAEARAPVRREKRGVLGWLVVLPVLAVIGGIVWYSVRGVRRGSTGPT